MRRWIALCVVGALGFGAGCSRRSSDTTARLSVEGQGAVTTTTKTWQPVSGDRGLGPGERVRISEGSAVISLSDDRRLELRAGSQVEMSVGADGELRPELTAGDLLVVSPGSEVTVLTDEVDAQVMDGAARISRGQTVVVGSYSATVRLESAGQVVTLPPFRQVGVPAAGLLPPGGEPLVYDPDDAWDQRFLADALQLRDQLVARSQGFSAQLPEGQARTPDFFRQLFPALAQEPAVDARVGPPRPAGESLVGLAISLTGRDGTFAERWNEVLAFRDDGADWGLVASDQGVARVALLTEIDAAIGRAPSLLLGAAAAPAPAPPGGAPPASAPCVNVGSPSGPSAPSVPAPSTPSQGQPPAPNASTGPLRTGIDPLDSTANSLIQLLGGLLDGAGT